MTMYLTIFGKPRYLGLVVEDEAAGEIFYAGDQLLVESSRGLEIAVVAGLITETQESQYRSIDNRQEGQPSSDSGLQNVNFIHRVTAGELAQEEQNRQEEDQVLIRAREILSLHTLDMKLVDVEFLNDRRKLYLYFTSEQRVDFRAYVRDLAREFKTRIELRQIGVRDEAKVVRGLGSCGKPCCCSYWLQRFMPIGIRMVKEQNLALNPSKISGLCGRLMCCMSFEQDNYHELWNVLPAQGSKIKTKDGTYILLGVDISKKLCHVKGPESEIFVPVEEFPRFKETILAGIPWNQDDQNGVKIAERGEMLPPLNAFKDGVGEQSGVNTCDDSCENCRVCLSEKKKLPKIAESIQSLSEKLEKTGEEDGGKSHHRRRKNRRAVSDENKKKKPTQSFPMLRTKTKDRVTLSTPKNASEEKTIAQQNFYPVKVIENVRAKNEMKKTTLHSRAHRDGLGLDEVQKPSGDKNSAVEKEQ